MGNRAATDRERTHLPNENVVPTANPPLAYLLTFTTYGTWLHGDERGSVDRHTRGFDSPRLAANPLRAGFERDERMEQAALVLDGPMRTVAGKAIRDFCDHRGWPLLALNVRSNHVHIVVSSADRPEMVLTACKAAATRRLREVGLVSAARKLWTRHGSTRYLWTQDDLDRAATYVTFGQDRTYDGSSVATSIGTLPAGRGSDSSIVNRQSPGALP